MGLGVADLEGYSARVHEMSIYEKRETERNERPHVGRDNEWGARRAGRWWSLVTSADCDQVTSNPVLGTLTRQVRSQTATTPRRFGHPADTSWTSAATWQNRQPSTKAHDEARYLGAASRSNLVISLTDRLCSTRLESSTTRWWPSPQSYRETQSAQCETQQTREH